MHRAILIAGCLVAGAVSHARAADSDGTKPDDRLTPGAVETTSLDVICGQKTSERRNVSGSAKLAAYRRYGMKGPTDYFPGTNLGPPFEIDHLISVELGGSNDITNLWPEAYTGTVWNAHTKDRYENFLHKQICLGKMTPEAAQSEIRTDWIAGYKSHHELPDPVDDGQ